MKNCTICGKPIVLTPTAQERANRYGGTPARYEALFDMHSECLIAKRNADTLALMRRLNQPKEK